MRCDCPVVCSCQTTNRGNRRTTWSLTVSDRQLTPPAPVFRVARDSLVFMSIRSSARAFLVALQVAAFCFGGAVLAQTPGRAGAPKPPPASASSPTVLKVEANLLQLMRGIVYPASNVI